MDMEEANQNQAFKDCVTYSRMGKINYNDTEEVLISTDILKTQPTEENPYVIESYPYGFKRTQMRVYVESTKRGDRVVRQTLNPNTKNWNKPKKTTYQGVVLMGISQKTGYIVSALGFSHWGNKENFEKKLKFVEENNLNLNEFQKNQIKELKVVHQVREHLTVKIQKTEYKHKITDEIVTEIPVFEMGDYEEVGKEEREEQEKQSNKDLNALYNHYANKEGLKQ